MFWVSELSGRSGLKGVRISRTIQLLWFQDKGILTYNRTHFGEKHIFFVDALLVPTFSTSFFSYIDVYLEVFLCVSNRGWMMPAEGPIGFFPFFFFLASDFPPNRPVRPRIDGSHTFMTLKGRGGGKEK